MKENRKNIISPSQIPQIIATQKMMKNDFPSLHIIQKYYFPYCIASSSQYHGQAHTSCRR